MTTEPLHEASTSAVPDTFQLFDLPHSDMSLLAYRMLEFTPITTDIHPMEFTIPAVDEFVDLSRSYFKVRIRLKKNDGTDLADGDKLYPAPNLAHTLIKQMTIHLNGTLINAQTDTYAYKAFLETVLNYDQQEANSLLRPQGWLGTHTDGSSALDFATPLTANNTDSAGPHAHYTALAPTKKAALALSRAEQGHYQGGAFRTLIFKPHSEIFHLSKALVPGVEIKIRFYFNAPAFFLNGVGEQGRLTKEDIQMSFHLCQLSLSAPLYKTLDETRHSKREVAKFPTVRSEIRVFSHPANMTEFNQGNLFQGRIPDRLIVGLLHAHSYNGHYQYNPFSFQKFGLVSIKQLVRGEEYPYQTLELNQADTHRDMEGYFRFLQASEAWRKGQSSMVTPEMWGGTGCCTLFMFNNVANGAADGGLMNPRQSGELRLVFRLGAAINHVINVLLYAEFENVLEIDGNSAVMYNAYQGGV